MIKIVKNVWMLVLILTMFIFGVMIGDRHTLRSEMIRLRVVAASDRSEDQNNKLAVRDAVNNYISENMPDDITAEEAIVFFKNNCEALEKVAEACLHQLNATDNVRVYLTDEAAETRYYHTFSLPAGVYKTLRVDIGDSAGANWWCVAFPSLCLAQTVDGFQDTAISCGMNEGLIETLSADGDIKVRFYLLELLGRLEILLHNL